jgi:hypothetical protein
MVGDINKSLGPAADTPMFMMVWCGSSPMRSGSDLL